MDTTWIEQEHGWEAGAKQFAVSLLGDAELAAYAERLAERAERVVLGTTLLKLTVAGVPDIYGGDELPFLALVDPDNRRPVDWDARRRSLASADPPPKLDLIRRALELRTRRPEAVAGAYEPLDAGPDTCAFLRGGDVQVAVAVRGELREPATRGAWRDVVRTRTLLLSERA